MGDKPKVLIVATHPVQYQVPWFVHLQKCVPEFQFDVMYITLPDAQQQGSGFNESFHWDIPLFDDYNWSVPDQNHIASNQRVDNFLSLRLKNTKKLISKHNPDVVLLTGWQSFALLQILRVCNSLQIPVLVRGDSNNLKPRKALVKFLHRHLLKRFDKFLAVGKANKAFYIENAVPESQIHLCPHFVDNHFFMDQLENHKNDRHRLCEKWSIPKDAFCFCYVGKLSHKKQVLDILKAFKDLASSHAHLLIVGTGELMQQAQAYTQQHKLNVSFAGFINQSEIAKCYVASDCLVLASNFDETWGLVVNEAMICTTPAIVSDQCGCHPDLIEQGVTGYTFKCNDTADLTSKMATVIELPDDQYSSLADNAQLKITRDYSIKSATHGLVNALNSVFKS